MRITKLSITMLCAVFLAIFLFGCGSSSNREGTETGPPDSVARVNESQCITCHSSTLEKLSGDPIVADYEASVHNLNGVGCQDCHGGGAEHNGVGPLPYPRPNHEQCSRCHDGNGLVTKYAASKHFNVQIENEEGESCQRCHTHQGAVLAAKFGFTGDGDVMDAMVNAPGLIPDPEPIKCNTCHETHKPQTLRVDAGWNPSATTGAFNAGSTQYRLCTQCHGYINPAGELMGSGTTTSGTALVGHHETSWYRIIGATHFDDPTTQSIEGYVMRTKGPANANPCFDCHGHEAKTNSNNDPASSSYVAENATIYTDWAQSGHAGRILTAKFAAAQANPVNTALPRTDPVRVAQGLAQVDAVMAAGALANIPANAGQEITPFTVDGVQEYWAQTNEEDCQRCHTSTGLVNYLSDVAGYKGSNLLNDYSHLIGWTNLTKTRPTVPPNSPMQQEVLYCWGCHSNAGAGTLRTPGAITPESLPDAAYTFNGVQVTFPDVSGSNICVACHTGYRNRDGIALTTRPDGSNNTRSLSFRAHNLIAGSTVFNEKAHSVFEFDIDANGNFAEHYTNVAYFAHDKIGLAAEPGTGSNGPCVACHMGGSSHTFVAVTKNTSDVITAITNQALCDSCHTSEHGLMTAAKLEEEKAGLTEATDVLKAYLLNTITNYQNIDLTTHIRDGGFGAYTYPLNDYGAFQNSMYPDHEKAAYVHNRIYVKRIIFDSIDWLDNGAFNGTITINAATYPEAAAWFGATAGTATRP